MTLFTILATLALLATVIVFFYGRENSLAMILGPADQGRTDFKTLKRSNLPNNSLICPENHCENAIPEIVAPVFSVSADGLRERLRASLVSEKRLERVHTNDPAMRERYVQRSNLFRFADTIQVEYIPLGTDRSTIALFSSAQVGLSDGQVNRKRLKRWLKRLEDIVVTDD
ncbi:MAG: DUF1499 domain-containing protein [Rhizobiaceae bacterium]|nr:DUF1499 domain-containing protein [Rhizobiaceae bacterium]